MQDDLSQAIDDAYPSCPRCGGRLDDAGTVFDLVPSVLRCRLCGLEVPAGG